MIAASTSFPPGVNEADMACALRGSPIDIVKCETNDLFVPASSEIVIEGEVSPYERHVEGPFGEYTGYSVTSDNPQPFVKVNCVTHRNDPILAITNMGKPWDEYTVPTSIAMSAVEANLLEDAGLPINSVYEYPVRAIVVSTKSQPGIAEKIVKTLRESGARTDGNLIFVVGEDVDVSNLEDVVWCLTTRLNPSNGIHFLDRVGVSPFMPWLTPEERQKRTASKVYFDATFPSSWTPEYLEKHARVIDFERGWPKEVGEKVLSRWHEYGYDSASFHHTQAPDLR